MSRIAPALFLAAALLPCSAYCQSETAATADSSAGSEADDAPELRKPRSWALGAEIGMNSLSSKIGPMGTWYVAPHYALDFGVGLSNVGLRPGVRGRYLFSLEKTAYFAALGLKYGLGSGETFIEVDDPDTKEKIGIQIDGSGFADASVGVEYLADNGFQVIANAGYSVLLGGRNYHYRPGTTVSDKTDNVFSLIFGSGIMLSVSLGKAF